LAREKADCLDRIQKMNKELELISAFEDSETTSMEELKNVKDKVEA
jgi:hypothetical protein